MKTKLFLSSLLLLTIVTISAQLPGHNNQIRVIKQLQEIATQSFEPNLVRITVAKNLNTPTETLIELAKDSDHIVRASVAGNSNTPKETLIELAKDSVVFVRAAVAGNPNTPAETLKKLAKE